VTARLFTVFGPGEHPGRLLPSLITAAAAGMPVALSAGAQQRDFTYVEDVADGLLRLGATPDLTGTVVNLATGRLTSVREFAERAARVLEVPAERLQFGALPGHDGEMPHASVHVDLLRQLTGWVPGTSIEAGVSRTRAFLTART
jgi:nucleoside-diphosphate-sugar epimerase